MSNSSFAECVQGDCTNGIGQFRYKNSSLLASEFNDGRAHGYGVKTFSSGTICEGYTREGKWHGLRHCYWENTGKRFYGNYNSGKRSAEAIQIDSAGNIDIEGYYYRGKLQRSYEIDRSRLLERLQTMRAEAPPEITKLIPYYLQVFYIPSPSQTKLAVEPMQSPSFANGNTTKTKSEALQITLPGGESNESINPRTVVDLTVPSTKARTKDSTYENQKSDKTKESIKPKIDEATRWAINVCKEEGYAVGSTQFGVCVGKMKQVY